MADHPHETTVHRRSWHLVLGLLVTCLALLAPAVAVAEEPAAEEPAAEHHDVGGGEHNHADEVTILGKHGRWTKFEAPLGRVYGNGTQGYVAIFAGTLDDVCGGGAPPSIPGLFRQKKDGTWVVKTLPGGHWATISVYETDLEVFAFFDTYCPLFGTPEFPEPFATGKALLRDKAWDLVEPFANEQFGRYRNSVRGYVVGADGSTYRIRALADYEIAADGTPTFFRDVLKVRPTGW
jgi:hypothetical protein